MYFSFWTSKVDDIVLAYPTLPIYFAGEQVPIEENLFIKERFDKEFLGTSHNLYQFYLYVKRYPVYIPDIEQALQAADIPDDFKYLPIAESALRNDVVSSAGAAGIWQFMPDTGREYGLRVDEFIDERYHFEKATRAAVEHLWDLYASFWDWTLAAAAYNRWTGGIQRSLDAQRVDNYYDLYLNEETSRYVFRILGIKYMLQAYFKDPEVITTLIGWVHEKPLTNTIKVWKIDDLALWASENNYVYNDIRVLNRWILQDSLPEWEWEIQVLQK